MTDNGSCYRSKSFRLACKRLDLRQVFTKPYTPKTNGKAERFIQTTLGCALPIRTQISEPSSCSIGSIATIGIGHMVA
jgi:transposase InsO family protein